MKKVLIITYYWPPGGGSSVLRWLNFAKYLPEFGWEPTVLTPENPEFQFLDNSLLNQIPKDTKVLKIPIKEPFTLYRRILIKKRNEKIGVSFIDSGKGNKFMKKLSIWIRGNFFIPDARMFWIKPASRFVCSYLKNKQYDALITTGPPHSLHLIGYRVKKKNGINWLADFRDPWTNIDYYNDLYLTRFADKKHHRLEKKVLTTADNIITVGRTMSEEFDQLGANKVTTITNGFDKIPIVGKMDDKFTILHIGSMPKSRNPELLWKVLSKIKEEIPTFAEDLKIELIGAVDVSIVDMIKFNELEANLHMIKNVSNEQAIERQCEVQILLLVINNSQNAKGILTNKFFEYLAAKRPILGIGPVDGDAASILKETSAGVMFDYAEERQLYDYIKECYNRYKNSSLVTDSVDIEKYSRKRLTEQLAKVLG